VYTVHDYDMDEPARLSEIFLNSTVQSAFTAIQNIKRPSKESRSSNDKQNVTWTGSGQYDQLEVHTGSFGLDRVKVNHEMLRTTFKRLVTKISQDLQMMGVTVIRYKEFKETRDSRTSTAGGEGMSVFNQHSAQTAKFLEGKDRSFRLEFLEKASQMYRLTIAAIHLCGGPGPRGTEEAVIRLLNSSTEAVRNVQMMECTIGIENG